MQQFAFMPVETFDARLVEAERKYEFIKQRIQAYDQVLNDFNDIKKTLKQNNDALKEQSSLLSEHSNQSKSKMANAEGQLQNLKGRQDANSKSLEDQNSMVSSVLAKVHGLQEQCKVSIENLAQKVALVAMEQSKSLSKCHELEQKISEIEAQKLSQVKNLEKLYVDYFGFKEKVDAKHASLNEQIDKLKKSLAAMPDFQDWSSKIYTRVDNSVSYRDKQATAYVDKKIEALAQDFATNPLSAESIKASLASELQSFSLDAKNAYLKSNNCAQQIQLLEKKLENLTLIIKKYELSN